MQNAIHPTALVAAGARIGAGTQIGPFAVIEDDVVLGENNVVGAHAVIKSGSRLGNGNAVYEHAVLGGPPQDLGFTTRPTFLEIGNGNILREFVTIHRASKEGASTVLGDNNFLMATTHVGHDCRIGNHVVMAPSTGIGGHVRIEDRAFVSGGVMVHQYVRIGRNAMIGGNAKITQDVLPYCITDGVPGSAHGLNLVGLKRAGFSLEDIRSLKQAYRTLMRSGLALAEALARLEASSNAHVKHLAGFVAESKRGFHRERER